MTDGQEPGRHATLMGWAQDARVRSAACTAQAGRAAESAAALGDQADRMIERLAERNPEFAQHLQAIAVTAASQRAAIAECKRSFAAGRPSQLLPGARNGPVAAAATGLEGHLGEIVIIQERDRTNGVLQNQVIQAAFTAGLMLQDAAEMTAEPEVRWRIEAAADGLDELIRLIRDALFNLSDRPPGRGSR